MEVGALVLAAVEERVVRHAFERERRNAFVSHFCQPVEGVVEFRGGCVLEDFVAEGFGDTTVFFAAASPWGATARVSA